MMKKNVFRYIFAIVLFFITFSILPVYSSAESGETDDEPEYVNPETGYEVYLYDDQGLYFSPDEKQKIIEAMIPLTDYGNVCLFTTSLGSGEVDAYSEGMYKNRYGNSDGMSFTIDMGARMLWVKGFGKTQNTLTSSKCNEVTDLVYKSASAGNYTKTAVDLYGLIYDVLNGKRIAQPLKYIGNIFYALTVSFLISFAECGKE